MNVSSTPSSIKTKIKFLILYKLTNLNITGRSSRPIGHGREKIYYMHDKVVVTFGSQFSLNQWVDYAQIPMIFFVVLIFSTAKRVDVSRL